ncbi:MAG: cupin domain-containing protein [Acidobacteria bacterium]|nr:cupin domain-containing protein [Acidobacteriota bacterium]MCI0720442.1 cupin domain-containing protein [Acidobacteriota bacterium]
MTKPSALTYHRKTLLPGRQKKLLFESAHLPIQCWLEHLSPKSSLERCSQDAWEEVLLIEGQLLCERRVYKDIYLCLPPHQTAPAFCTLGSGAVLFRTAFGGEHRNADNCGQVADGKAPAEVADFERLVWNEIPARRAGDPGGRVAELSKNTAQTRITSLMDCHPGWILDEHDHPSDVLTFCIRGGGILGIKEESYAYQAGHLVVIPAGVRHRFAAGDEGALLIVFVFEPFLR